MEYLSSDDETESNYSEISVPDSANSAKTVAPTPKPKAKYMPKIDENGNKLTKKGTVDKRTIKKDGSSALNMKKAQEKLKQIKEEAKKNMDKDLPESESDEEIEESEEQLVIAPKSDIKKGMKEVKDKVKTKVDKRYHQLKQSMSALTVQMNELKAKNEQLAKQANKPRVKIVQPANIVQPVQTPSPSVDLEKIKSVIRL